MDNLERFQGVDFEEWAHREELRQEEEFLLGRYLDPSRPTVEAGTGGGCILLSLSERGFVDLSGFDKARRMIEAASKRARPGSVRLSVQDASKLDYPDAAFGQAIYLQQVLCLIEDEPSRQAAFREAYRILMPGGVALFSFLSYEDRIRPLPLRAFVRYLGLLRRLSGTPRSLQSLPWGRYGKRPNFAGLLDRGAHAYWYRVDEATRTIKEAGFQIEAAGSSAQIARGIMFDRPEQLRPDDVAGGLYYVCRKGFHA
jgi:SAM-dependent methyltransferase